MRRWTLALAMAALVAARLAADGHPPLERGLEGLSLGAALLAAGSFEAGDPPRLPWILRSAGVGLILAAHLVAPLEAGDGPRIAHVLVIVANLFGAAAMLRFLGVVRASGLATPPQGAARLILAALRIAAAVALAACVAGVLQGPLGSPAELLRGLALTVSAAADALVFVVAARLVQALLPMRDGLAAQPYLLLAVDGLSFLMIDLGHASGPSPAIARLLPVVAALGGSAGLLAAVAQAAIVRRHRGRGAAALPVQSRG